MSYAYQICYADINIARIMAETAYITMVLRSVSKVAAHARIS